MYVGWEPKNFSRFSCRTWFAIRVCCWWTYSLLALDWMSIAWDRLVGSQKFPILFDLKFCHWSNYTGNILHFQDTLYKLLIFIRWWSKNDNSDRKSSQYFSTPNFGRDVTLIKLFIPGRSVLFIIDHKFVPQVSEFKGLAIFFAELRSW